VRGTFDYAAAGVSSVTPLGLTAGSLAVRWPELTTWLNPDSVSLSVSVDASWMNIVALRTMIDAALPGNTRVNPELTLGATVRIRTLRVGLEAHYGEGNTMRELREHPLGPGALGFVRAAF
jgi:hypothetical protein